MATKEGTFYYATYFNTSHFSQEKSLVPCVSMHSVVFTTTLLELGSLFSTMTSVLIEDENVDEDSMF